MEQAFTSTLCIEDINDYVEQRLPALHHGAANCWPNHIKNSVLAVDIPESKKKIDKSGAYIVHADIDIMNIPIKLVSFPLNAQLLLEFARQHFVYYEEYVDADKNQKVVFAMDNQSNSSVTGALRFVSPKIIKAVEKKINISESSDYERFFQTTKNSTNSSPHVSYTLHSTRFSLVTLLQRVVWEDTSALHSLIEAQITNIHIIKCILRFVPPQCLEIKNEDELTPLELAFQKKLWMSARALAEHQIKANAASSAFLQEFFFKAMREQGGVDFLPHLLDLRERYFPNLDLNFSADTGGRTPWWYLVNSNDVSVMCRTLQTLKEHSVDLMQLLTDTERQTRLVEEAADKNRLLFIAIQKVAGWHYSSGDQDVTDEDETCFNDMLLQVMSCSSISFPCFDEPENQVSISDSSDEEWKQVDSRSKTTKQRLKNKLVQNSTGYSSFNEPEKQVSISHEPGVPDKASVTLGAQSTSDSIPVVSFHFL